MASGTPGRVSHIHDELLDCDLDTIRQLLAAYRIEREPLAELNMNLVRIIAQLQRGLYWIARGVWFEHRAAAGGELVNFKPDEFDPMPRDKPAARPRTKRAAQRAAFFDRPAPVSGSTAAKALLRTMTGGR